MSGLPWFELDVDMPDDPKCIALGVRLRTPLAFGYVVRLYAYCYRHGTDRFEGAGAAATIEEASRWRGKDGALVDALEAEGFLDREGSTLVVHGVADRLVPHLAVRISARERQRKHRDRAATKLVGHAVVTRDSGVTSRQKNSESRGNTDIDIETKDLLPIQIDDRDPAPPGSLGSVGARSTAEPTTVERLRIAVSQSLGVIGPGGGGLPLPASRKLGQVIRDANAAVEALGFEAVVSALVAKGQAARASGEEPETFGFFAGALSGLAAGEPTPAARAPRALRALPVRTTLADLLTPAQRVQFRQHRHEVAPQLDGAPLAATCAGDGVEIPEVVALIEQFTREVTA